jgi:hypothetical protein
MDLAQIRAEARPFPTHVLNGAESAACFFCAGFLGRNAEIHVYDAGIRDVLAVDHNQELITRMKPLYPGWTFVCDDAFAVRDSLVRAFDIVVADPQLSHMDRALDELSAWQNLARKAVILGCSDPDRARKLGAAEVMHRAGNSWWATWYVST